MNINKKVIDHLGNEFDSWKEMCKYYGVKYNTFISRKNKNMSLEECLSPDQLNNSKNKKQCVDHIGNEFGSLVEMCEYHDVNYSTFISRKNKNMSLEECLSPDPLRAAIPCIDHLGNEFKSVQEMCDYHGVSIATFYNRKNIYGWSLSDCLDNSNNRPWTSVDKKCHDHLGREFPSLNDMCMYYNISYRTFRSRRRAGWSVEEALTIKARCKNSNQIYNNEDVGDEPISQYDCFDVNQEEFTSEDKPKLSLSANVDLQKHMEDKQQNIQQDKQGIITIEQDDKYTYIFDAYDINVNF